MKLASFPHFRQYTRNDHTRNRAVTVRERLLKLASFPHFDRIRHRAATARERLLIDRIGRWNIRSLAVAALFQGSRVARSACIGITLAAVAFAADPLPLSLKRAVEMATSPEGNTNVQLSAEAAKQAEARSAQARAALLPDLNASLAERDQTVNLAAMGVKFNLPIPGFSFPRLVGPFTVMDARLSVADNVLDLASFRRFQASKSGVAAARAEITNVDNAVAGQVARAYLAAVKADADLETAESNITLAQAVLKQAEDQKAAGTGTGIEITRAKVQLANDEQRRVQAANNRRAARLRLFRAIGMRLDSEVQLTDRLEYKAVDAVTLDAARAQALKDRPDLKAQQEREHTAQLSTSATKLERLPTLQAFGDYGSIGSGFDSALPTRTYGIQLKVPIFDGGRRSARLAESASQYRQEKVRTNDLKEQVELDVRLSLDELQSAEDEVKVATEGLSLAENELAQARRRYDAGVAGSLEVTDAQTRLERARDNRTAALYAHNVARVDLAQAMGQVRSVWQ
jgi:outer membrane protein